MPDPAPPATALTIDPKSKRKHERGRQSLPSGIRPSVLIVGADATERQVLSETLWLGEELTGIEAATRQAAFEAAAEWDIRSVLIDNDLPDIDGRDLCRLMRRQGVKVPIILLSVHRNDADIILGLDSGASDYITKPFHGGVLLARIRAQHRHFEQLDDANYAIGPYTFRPSTKIMTHRMTDRRIHLTSREASILKSLYRMGGRAVPPERIIGEVWGQQADVSPHAVKTHIYRLRRKLQPSPTSLPLLVTDPCGYRLVR